nr:uncharacterized protein LOC117687045 isoform X1 [Crassostrea gigas]
MKMQVHVICKSVLHVYQTSSIFFLKTILAGAALFVGCHGYVPPPYPSHSDLTSGSLAAAAGSIGIVSLAVSAALMSMSSLQNFKDPRKKTTTPEPAESCEDVLAAERQRFEEEKIAEKERFQEEKRDLEARIELSRQIIIGACEEFTAREPIKQPDCIKCFEFLDDQTSCLQAGSPCAYANFVGVCVYSP